MANLPLPLLTPIMPGIEAEFFSNGDCSENSNFDSSFCTEAFSRAAYAHTLTSAISASLNFVSAPLMGRCSDAYGRRSLLIFSQFVALLPFLSLFLHILLDLSLYWYYICYGIAGIGNGGVIMFAFTADITTKEERLSWFGRLEGISAIGILITPAFNFLLSRTAAISIIFCCLVSCFLYSFLIPESLPEDKRVAFNLVNINSLRNFYYLYESVLFQLITLVIMIYSFVGSGIIDVQFIYQTQAYHLTVKQNSAALLIFGAGSFVANFMLLPLCRKFFEDPIIVIFGLLMQITCYLLFAFTAGPYAFAYVAQGFAGLAVVTNPVLQTICANHAVEQGVVQGAIAAVTDLAGAIGSFAMGPVFAKLNSQGNTSWIFMIGAGFLAFASCLMFVARFYIPPDLSVVLPLSIQSSPPNNGKYETLDDEGPKKGEVITDTVQ